MKLLICTQAVDRRDQALGFFHRWIEEFAKNCESVTVICLQEGDHDLPKNVRVFSLGKENGTPLFGKLTYALRFFIHLWRIRGSYDSVFVHMNPEYVLLGGLFWRLMGKPVGLWYEHKSVTLGLRLAVLLASATFSASKDGFRLHTRKAHTMGHGIDTGRVIPPHIQGIGTVRLMTSGRVAQSKRIDVIIDAYLRLQQMGIHVSLTVFGAPISAEDRAYEETLAAKLRAAGEDPARILVGSVPHAELPARRAAMDYFLHASETGSLDKAVLDAIMSDVIPISSSDAYIGLFTGLELSYPQGDGVALAERIRALEVLSQEERARIRKTLKDRVVKEHSLESLVPKIVYILKDA